MVRWISTHKLVVDIIYNSYWIVFVKIIYVWTKDIICNVLR